MRAPVNPVRIGVLGPLRVETTDGRVITPSGPLQRRLLALLVLRRGNVTSISTAIDVLWPEQAPADPLAALQNQLYRLRSVLPDDLIDTSAAGYRLDPELVDVDVDRLEQALAQPLAEGGLAVVDESLSRWHGPAYPELADAVDAAAEVTRLDELRIRAVERRVEVRLAVGLTDGLVAELTSLVDAQPLRERPRELMMGALAVDGRHAEALRVYDDFRRLIGDELGIEPSAVLRAAHDDLLNGSGPSSPASVERLPAAATAVIGRAELLAEIGDLASAERLVTLVGPGGVGKTRVLIEVGRRIEAVSPDGTVVLCELAVAGPTTVVETVAAALHIDARPGVPLAGRIVDVLARSEVVLLLDNCEHVLEPAAALAEQLLTTCPNLRIVATSRERLRVAGEHVCRVPTLPALSPDSPGVVLFLQRARAASTDFAPGPTELTTVAEIVRRLDGLPLAIELAAARLHTHDLAEVAAGLDHRFVVFDSGSRTTTRHSSLAAAVAWSFDLLPESLQRTFCELSVFAGSFTITDAAAVCRVDRDTAVSRLAQLVERSLVIRAAGQRYTMLETLRSYGSEQLAAGGRVDAVAERHARYQVRWIADASVRLLEPGNRVLTELDAAVPELRGALGWLIDHGELDIAGELVGELLDYGFLRLRPDVLQWSEQLISADPEDAGVNAWRVRVIAAYAAWMAGDLDASDAHGVRSAELAERAGVPEPTGALMAQGSHELFTGNLDLSAELYLRAAASAKGRSAGRYFLAAASSVLAMGYAGDPRAQELADSLIDEVPDETPSAAYVWYCAGEADLAVDVARASSRLDRALEIAEHTGTSFVTGIAGASRASIEARVGDPVRAAADYKELIIHWRRAGMWSTQWTMLRSIAGLLDRLGRHRDAAVLEGAIRATSAGHRIFGADEVALADLGERLRAELGEEVYETALQEGSRLDGTTAVRHALAAL